MMAPVARVSSIGANATEGQVVFCRRKAWWNLSMIIAAVTLAPIYYSWQAMLICLLLTYFTLLIGHSVGMHRMMIHRTLKLPRVVEKLFIYCGVLVGMSGPFGVIKIHDTRDWAQRQSRCHDFFSHRMSLLKDLFWQLTCRFEFDRAPTITIETHYSADPFYRWLEKNWRWQQLPLAIFCYWLAGVDGLVWGIAVRVALSVVGHWTITHFCHHPGSGRWHVKGASLQASNLQGLGLITYGECWHNNHHAFPESAKIGLEAGQWDPAWWLILALHKLGIASDIGLPRAIIDQEDLIEVTKVKNLDC